VTKALQISIKMRGTLLCAMALMGLWPGGAVAQDRPSHSGSDHELTAEQNELIQAVRRNTARFQDFRQAIKEKFLPAFGCVSGDSAGAMGLHFVNMDNVKSGMIDVTKPQIVIYEPTEDGNLRLTGADFLVDAAQWDAGHDGNPPQLGGQLFHFFDAPNRFGLKPFYTLHVWAWKDNPNGAFVNWHPDVSCKLFQAPPVSN
jgi:hypothetical protein